jgi:hypothetical protein
MAETRDVVKWVLIGGGIAVLVFIVLPAVLCITVCGACAAGGMAITQGTEVEVQGFFSDLRANNLEAAYARTSQSFQASRDLAAFRQAVEDVPITTAQTAVVVTGRNVNAGGADFAVTLTGALSAPDRNPVPVEVRCLRVGERWFIDAVSIQGVAL